MPPTRSLFYLRFVSLVVSARLSSRHAINKLDNSPQHRDILCNAKQLNVQLEHLMFCKDVCTLYHATFRGAISRNHSTLRWAISRNATPFVCTLYHSPLRWPMFGLQKQWMYFSAVKIFLSITAFLGNSLILVALNKETSLHPASKLLYPFLATTNLLVGLLTSLSLLLIGCPWSTNIGVLVDTQRTQSTYQTLHNVGCLCWRWRP